MTLNYVQMFQAIQALSPGASIKMLVGGSWYVSHGIEIQENGLLTSPVVYGDTPELAIAGAWVRLTKMDRGYLPILRPSGMGRRAFKWNGFMWADA